MFKVPVFELIYWICSYKCPIILEHDVRIFSPCSQHIFASTLDSSHNFQLHAALALVVTLSSFPSAGLQTLIISNARLCFERLNYIQLK